MNLKPVIRWCRRYVSITLVAAIIVAAYVMFFNENSVMRTWDQEREIDELTVKISQATDTLEHYRRLNASLETDPQAMERIVREQYHMQQPDEDVYLVEE